MKQAVSLAAALGVGIVLGQGLSLVESSPEAWNGGAPHASPKSISTHPRETLADGPLQPSGPAGSEPDHDRPHVRPAADMGPQPDLGPPPDLGAQPGEPDLNPLFELAADLRGEEGELWGPYFLAELALSLENKGKGELAAALLGVTLDRWPEDMAVLEAGLWLLPTRVLPTLEGLAGSSPRAAQVLIEHYASHGNGARALELARLNLERPPLQWRTVSLLAEDDPALLVRHYRAIGREAYQAAGLGEIAAEALLAVGQAEEATELYREGVEEDEHDRWALIQWARVDPVAARAHIQEALRRRPCDPTLLVAELTLLSTTGAPAVAERRLEEYLESAVSSDDLLSMAYDMEEQATRGSQDQERLLRDLAWRLARRGLEQSPYSDDLLESVSSFTHTLEGLDFLLARHAERVARGDVEGAEQVAYELPGAVDTLLSWDPAAAEHVAARLAQRPPAEGLVLCRLAEALYEATHRVDLVVPLFELALVQSPDLGRASQRLSELR